MDDAASLLSAHGLDRISSLAQERRFPAGTPIFREGAQNEFLMVLCSGRVALDMHVPRRGSVRIMSLGAGDLLAWSAILGSGRMTASATALESTRVLAIPAGDVLSLCNADPGFGVQLMHKLAVTLANRLVATRLQLLDLFLESEPSQQGEPV